MAAAGYFGKFLGSFSTITRSTANGCWPTKQTCAQSSLLSPWLRQPVRARYVNWHMRKDALRREMVVEYAPLRLRVNAVRKNTIIPLQIREMADEQIHALPRNSCRNRVINRCALTSRPRGNLRRWRLSRIVWRHLADYNKLSGVTRACW